MALGLEPLGLDQDRPAHVVADVLQLGSGRSGARTHPPTGPRPGGGKVWPVTCRYAVSVPHAGKPTQRAGTPVVRLTAGGGGRQADHGSYTRLGILEAHVAAAAAQQLADDRQAEPAAAGVPVAGLVEPGEPVEDPLAVGLRDAGPVVGDGQLDPRPPPRGEATPACARAGPRCRRGWPAPASGPTAAPAPQRRPRPGGRRPHRDTGRGVPAGDVREERGDVDPRRRRGRAVVVGRASSSRSSTSAVSRSTSASRSAGRPPALAEPVRPPRAGCACWPAGCAARGRRRRRRRAAWPGPREPVEHGVERRGQGG